MDHGKLGPAPSGTLALDRAVGRWSLLALTINCVVGAGILGLPGRVFALAGGWTPFVLLAAAMLAIAVTLCLAELAGRFDQAGGPVQYCRSAFGTGAGFAAGWLSWTATMLSAAALLNVLAELLSPAMRVPIILIAGSALTALAMLGAARSARGSGLLTVLKLALLATVAIAGLLAPAMPAVSPPVTARPAAALVLLFFAFVGFERPTAMAGEAADPQRDVPFALVIGMLAVSLLYAGLFAACLRGVPDLATSTQPIAALSERILGATGGRIVSLGAAVVVLGTLSSQWITAPRFLLALAQDGQLPAALARLAARRRTPDVAIAATGVLAVLLALSGDVVSTVTASSASRLLIFLGCAAAMLRLKRMDAAPPSRFRLTGGTAIAIAVIAVCALLLASAASELPRLAVTLLIGGALWWLTSWTRRRSPVR